MLAQQPTPTIVANEKVTAKKSHWCTWCGQVIAKGEDYRRVRLKYGVNDATFRCEKVHLNHFKWR